jgi:hypothetical protein
MLDPELIHRARRVSLLALAERRTSLKRVAVTGGGEYAGPCPLCGGRDRFRVQAGLGRWLCRRCSPRWDDAIALEMKLSALAFPEAVRALAGGAWPVRDQARAPAPELRRPSLLWQARAQRLTREAAYLLWTPLAAAALAWLRRRGLERTTLQHWHVGYLPRVRYEPGWAWETGHEKVYLSAGVLIPSFTEGGLTGLKIRRIAGAPKYVQVRGSCTGLYLAATVTRQTTAVAVCEGELDALLLWQSVRTAPDLGHVAVVTPGSQAIYPRPEWLARLQRRRVLLLFDQDEAGERGAAHWLAARPDAVRMRWPDAKDLTDLHQLGRSLPDLLRAAL